MRAAAYADGFRAEAKIDEPQAHRPPARTHACSMPIRPLNIVSNAAGYGFTSLVSSGVRKTFRFTINIGNVKAFQWVAAT